MLLRYILTPKKHTQLVWKQLDIPTAKWRTYVGILLTHIYSNVHFLDTYIAYMCPITENGSLTLACHTTDLRS